MEWQVIMEKRMLTIMHSDVYYRLRKSTWLLRAK